MPRHTPRTAPTLSDVARHAGVSLATASRAINGSRNRVVGDELAERVRAAARELGYAPNAQAQAMASGATRTLGVIVHDLTDPYFSSIADAIATEARGRNLFMTLATTGNHVEHLAESVTALDSLRVRAMIIVGARWTDMHLNDTLLTAIMNYQGRGGRAVTIGTKLPGVDAAQVDNAGGARGLAEHLTKLGYESPLLLVGPEGHSTAAERSQAFLAAFEDLGIPVPPDHQIATNFTRGGGASGVRLALEAGLSFDCVVAPSDVMALGALSAARQSGLRIPEDFGLTGFGDVSTLADVTPSLTTVRVPVQPLAENAVQHALSDASIPPTDPTPVEATPVLRESTPRRRP